MQYITSYLSNSIVLSKIFAKKLKIIILKSVNLDYVHISEDMAYKKKYDITGNGQKGFFTNLERVG